MRWTAIAAFAALALTGCEKLQQSAAPKSAPPPAFIQKEFAKNPDADCVAHPPEHYQKLAETKKGMEELLAMHCQLQVRGDWHTSNIKDSKLKRGDALDKAMRCTTENIEVMKAMMKSGVTNIHC